MHLLTVFVKNEKHSLEKQTLLYEKLLARIFGSDVYEE